MAPFYAYPRHTYFIEYLETELGFAPSTIDTYDIVLSSFHVFLRNTLKMPQENIEQVRRRDADIFRYIDYMKEKGRAPSTINKHLSILKVYFDYLERTKVIWIDPAVKIPRLPDTFKRNFLLQEEMQEVRSRIVHNPDIALAHRVFVLLLLEGVRGKELMSAELLPSLVMPSQQTVEIQLPRHTFVFTGKETAMIRELLEETKQLRSLTGTNYLFYQEARTKGNTAVDERYSPLNSLKAAGRMKMLSRKFGLEMTITSIETGWLYHQIEQTPYHLLDELQEKLDLTGTQFRQLLFTYEKAKESANEQSERADYDEIENE